jgi:MYXO-CTERM domain-containing protein
MKTKRILPALLAVLFLAEAAAGAATLQVGPGKTYAVPSEAAAEANDGDIIEIDAGTYTGDVASWYANNITLKGVGGYAHLEANGNHAEGKAIWVIKGDSVTVEWIEFTGATVPDQNGAGIRAEGSGLTIRHCYFHDNEEGILGGAGEVLIEYSEFADNGYGDGYSHNMYLGNSVTVFTLRFCYTHHAIIGHNVKSRAQVNYILYNMIFDGDDGTASYEVDLPNAGTSFVIGNVIQQGPATDNSTILTYGEEGASNPSSDLYVVNNTFVNDRSAGTFIRNSASTPAVVVNNIFAGNGTVLDGPGVPVHSIESDDPGFVDRAGFDYHLAEGSAAINAGTDPGTGGGESLAPEFEYVYHSDGQARAMVDGQWDAGAFEYGTPPPPDDGDGPVETVDAPPDTADMPDLADPGDDLVPDRPDASEPADGTSDTAPPDTGTDTGEDGGGDEGCGCSVLPPEPASRALLLLLAAGLVLLFRRRS